jgi:mandelamide amidase
MALCMADVALLDGLISGEAALPPVTLAGLRLGIAPGFWRDLDADTRAIAEAALDKLRAAGVTLVEVAEERLQALTQPIGTLVVIHEARPAMEAWLREQGPGIGIDELARGIASPDVQAIYAQLVLPSQVPTADGLVDSAPLYAAAMASGRPALQAHYAELFARHALDAFIFPTTPVVAPAAGPEVNEPACFERLISNTEPSASAGLPGIQLPAGLGAASGLPVGLELDGPAGSDRRLLAIGIALEAVLGRIPRA